MKIAVIGAGNGGQAFAGYFASQGHEVNICEARAEVVERLRELGELRLEGRMTCAGKPKMVTNEVGKVIEGAELIMVTVTANAHKILAKQMLPYLADNQVIVLNPGRTGGAAASGVYTGAICSWPASCSSRRPVWAC